MDDDRPDDYTPLWEDLKQHQALYYLVWIGGALFCASLSGHFRPLFFPLGVLWMAGT